MKFAKELEDEAVPEWRVKYLNYKQGKKKIKTISKALRNINRTPSTPARPALVPEDFSERIPFTHYDFTRPRPKTSNTTHSLPEIEEVAPDDERAGTPRPPPLEQTESRTWFAQSPPILIPGGPSQDASKLPTPERTPLANPQTNQNRWQTRYGSIIGTPPDDEGETPGHFAALELPDPAISPVVPDRNGPVSAESSGQQATKLPEAAQEPHAPDAYHVGETTPPAKRSLRGSIARKMFRVGNADKDKKGQSSSHPESHPFPRSRIRRLFAAQALDQPTVNDVQLEAYKELDARQGEFFFFLDKELDKIESFYRMKEEEASARLQVLRKQLHEMRDRRLAEILKDQKPQSGTSQERPDDAYANGPNGKETGQANGSGPNFLKKPIEDALGRRHAPGKTSKAMQKLSSPPGPNAQKRIEDAKQDYVRRKPQDDVPYRFAKRRLKLALQEFYRGLELLKSYAILNRTGFRKINKKYDKAVQARPPLRYMAEKVNNAYFVQSDVIDNHLVAVEDLYSRYFERGNHKIAVRKLRSKLGAGDQSGTTFRNGLYVAAGVCFGISGLVNASDHLFGPDPVIRVQTAYLLQIYAGYFLALLLFLLFCLDCRIWTQSHINYVFIFEYDTRHVLDWRQLSEIPCFFLLLNGLFLYLNFQLDSSGSFYVYWPVILIFLSLLIMVLPVRVLYHRARRWWGYSNLRLLLAGLYPVEFRDFYLGDMYCSETYAMGQIEAFFCLYANGWNNPAQCNSNHSRLLGFFTTLPAIWRALQCLRRYYDSRNWFPHLANFMKYCCNILYYMTLSLYRIDRSNKMRAIFLTFAAINGVYSSFWDVYLDFSLGNFWAKHFFLRDHLAYKRVWVYYFAIVADVVLRQQWIFYAIFTQDLQHSALMSFFVSLAEVLRRGLWSLFRVENEHCNNVGKFRASRDIPLPYEIAESPEVTGKLVSPEDARRAPGTPATIGQADGHIATGADLERQSTRDSTLRLRKSKTPSGGAPLTPGMQALRRVGTVIASAHAQDFQKRRRPETESQGLVDDGASYAEGGADSDEEDEDDDEDGAYDEVAELRRQQAEDMESASSARTRRAG